MKSFSDQMREYEAMAERRESRRIEAAEDEDEREDYEPDYEAMNERRRNRVMGDFDVWPNNDQMEYFKRGGR